MVRGRVRISRVEEHTVFTEKFVELLDQLVAHLEEGIGQLDVKVADVAVEDGQDDDGEGVLRLAGHGLEHLLAELEFLLVADDLVAELLVVEGLDYAHPCLDGVLETLLEDLLGLDLADGVEVADGLQETNTDV